MKTAHVWVVGGAALLLCAAQASAGNVDAKLLDMLLANGSITKAQHSELTRDMVREQRVEKRASKEKLDKKDFTAFQQLAGWAANTKLTGDMRVRNDNINIEGERKSGGRDKDRQRIRARVGVITQVNPRGQTMYWIGSAGQAKDDSDGTDFHATFEGHMSVTPLHVDLTEHATLPEWTQRLRGAQG